MSHRIHSADAPILQSGSLSVYWEQYRYKMPMSLSAMTDHPEQYCQNAGAEQSVKHQQAGVHAHIGEFGSWEPKP